MTMTREDAQRIGRAGQVLFGAAVRERRKEKDWSQENLAEKAGMDRQSVNRAENATTAPSVDKVYRLAAALGCAPGDLLPELSAEQIQEST